jgi:FKBP-type peptidyl-prolyl cis-trans isomerase (trigger factor)
VNVTRNNIDDLNAVISIELKKEDYLPQVEKAINQHRNTIAIKGFRKGHVPASLVKKMYGNSILLEELNRTVTEALNKRIEEEQLSILGRPLPKENSALNFDINEPSDFTFEYEIGLSPQVNMQLGKDIRVEKPVITIDDKTLDDEVEKIAQRYGTVTNPDEVKEGKEAVMEKAELNQELFDKVYGPDVVSSLEAFKEKVRKELQDFSDRSAENKLKENIYTALMDTTDVAFPDAFLKRFIKSSNEKPIEDDQLDKEYPQFVKGLKWNLITAKIAQENNIRVEMEDVRNFSKEQLRAQLAMYNPSGKGIEEQYIDMLNDNMMSKEDHVKKSYDGALEQKLFTFIEDQITVEEKPATFDEFFNKK